MISRSAQSVCGQARLTGVAGDSAQGTKDKVKLSGKGLLRVMYKARKGDVAGLFRELINSELRKRGKQWPVTKI